MIVGVPIAEIRIGVSTEANVEHPVVVKEYVPDQLETPQAEIARTLQ